MDPLEPRQNLARSFTVAFAGLFSLLRYERNFKVEAACGVAAVALGAGLRIDRFEWLIVITTIMLVLSAEALYAALERVVDLASPDWHALAKSAKDTAAAAVLLSALGAVAVGLVIFLPRLWGLASG